MATRPERNSPMLSYAYVLLLILFNKLTACSSNVSLFSISKTKFIDS